MSGHGRSSENGSSKADTLVKVVLVFFISLLSFSVGTFVGKQVSDSDHRRMALDGEFKGERNIASVDEKSEGAEPADKITEKEVESLTEEFVNKEKSREPAEAGHHEISEEHEHAAMEHETAKSDGKAEAGGYKTYEHANKGKVGGAKVATKDTEAHGKVARADGAHKVTEKVLDGKAPTDGREEERKPQSVLPSVANSAIGKYAVQVASYADEKEAKTHAADLKGKGFTAFYLSADVHGKTWFRVLVGLFDNMKSADEFRAQLIKDVGTKSAIVTKIVQ